MLCGFVTASGLFLTFRIDAVERCSPWGSCRSHLFRTLLIFANHFWSPRLRVRTIEHNNQRLHGDNTQTGHKKKTNHTNAHNFTQFHSVSLLRLRCGCCNGRRTQIDVDGAGKRLACSKVARTKSSVALHGLAQAYKQHTQRGNPRDARARSRACQQPPNGAKAFRANRDQRRLLYVTADRLRGNCGIANVRLRHTFKYCDWDCEKGMF